MFSTPAYKKYIRTIQPAYTPPSAPTVKKYLKVKYLDEKSKLKSVLSEQIGVGLTSDMWTSKKIHGYITATGHYITQDLELKHCVLATRRVINKHSGENIFSVLLAVEKEFEIEGKISGLTSDNASNMKSASAKHNFSIAANCHIQCFAHTLQLAVNDTLDQQVVQEAVSPCRKLVEHFNRSTQANDVLESYQKLQGQAEQLTLHQDTKTRWNSTYLMFQ